MDAKEQIALRNDFRKLSELFNPQYVTIRAVDVPGLSKRLQILTHNVPTFVMKNNLMSPEYSTSIAPTIDVYPGYPKTKPRVYYGNEEWLHHVNVFISDGHDQCTDAYDPEDSSVVELAEKTLRAIVFDPTVTRYDSMANSGAAAWQHDMEARHRLPTMNPALLFKRNNIRSPRAI